MGVPVGLPEGVGITTEEDGDAVADGVGDLPWFGRAKEEAREAVEEGEGGVGGPVLEACFGGEGEGGGDGGIVYRLHGVKGFAAYFMK